MKVSIIIPIYKVEKEIARCLESVCYQDYKNVEIVLVNDCTPDNSFHIARDYISSNSKVEQTLFVEHEVNQGLSCARNSGINAATGDYLFFLDSDDALTSSDVISHLVSYVEKDPDIEMVMGNYQKFDDQGIFEVAQESRRLFESNDEIYIAYSKRQLWITAWGKLVSRKFVIDNNLFFKPGIYHEDELWSFNVFRLISKLFVTPVIVYNYYDRQGSIMSQIVEKNIDDLIVILKEMANAIDDMPSYHKKETIILIERYRRELLAKVIFFSDKAFQQNRLREIKEIKLPFILKKRPLKQNLLLRFPTRFVVGYLNFKYR